MVAGMRLGFGASGAWGQKWFSEGEACALIEAALAVGVSHFDTAGFYAEGEAERRLGAALRALGVTPFVSTKTGTTYRRFDPPLKDFSESAIRRDVEASRKRLGRDRLDLLYLHGPSDEALVAARPVLEALKAEGKIAQWGLCGEGAGLQGAIDAGAGAIMGVYNLLRREHAEVFARAKAKGLAVVAIAPLAQGLYDPALFAPTSLAGVWRLARALAKNRPELARARAIRPALESVDGWAPAELALAFALAVPSVDVAMTTTTKHAHLMQSAAAARRILPPDVLARLASLDGHGAGA